MTKIYKICAGSDWEAAQNAGGFHGAGVDLADGYIHFSTAETVAETAEKYFRGRSDLLLVEVEADHLGADLKWEPSRGGLLFPHLYGVLPVGRAQAVYRLSLDTDGVPIIPQSVLAGS